MKIVSLTKQQAEVVKTNSGLKTYLTSLENGKTSTPRSWLYENESADDILASWLKRLKAMPRSLFNKEIIQYEETFLPKFGPQGGHQPIEELMDIVTEGFSSVSSSAPKMFRDPLWMQAKEIAVEKLFKETGLYHKLRPRGLDAVLDDMAARDTLESNSGYPDFARRKKPDVIVHAKEAIRSGAYKEFPAIALFRTYNGKTRLVWMYPMAVNMLEATFCQPLKASLMAAKLPFLAPWRGYEDVKLELTNQFEQGLFVSASDFSHTDAHFLKWQILEVFDVIKHAFQEQYWPQLKESLLNVCSIPLIIGKDRMVEGDHGVSSGSNWTNDVETYLDFIAEVYLMLKGLVSDVSTAIGDDVSHKRRTYDPKFAEKIAFEYRRMGFDVNAEKVTNRRDTVIYLQRIMRRGEYSAHPGPEGKRVLSGVYRTIKALNSSLWPEKFHNPKLWSKDMFCVRQFMILENCIDHPLFEEFVIFVCKGSPYLSDFAKRSATEIDAALRESRLVPGLNPTYNQEKRDKPLSSFASIRIASMA